MNSASPKMGAMAKMLKEEKNTHIHGEREESRQTYYAANIYKHDKETLYNGRKEHRYNKVIQNYISNHKTTDMGCTVLC